MKFLKEETSPVPSKKFSIIVCHSAKLNLSQSGKYGGCQGVRNLLSETSAKCCGVSGKLKQQNECMVKRLKGVCQRFCSSTQQKYFGSFYLSPNPTLQQKLDFSLSINKTTPTHHQRKFFYFVVKPPQVSKTFDGGL